MLTLTIITVVVVLAAAVLFLTFLLGFRVGGTSWFAETQRLRMEAAAAERELHDLTRSAFVAMAEEAERRRES